MSKKHPTRKENNLPLPAAKSDVWRVKFYGVSESQMTVNAFFYTDNLLTIGTGDYDTQVSLMDGIMLAGGLKDKYTAAVSADWKWDRITIDCPTTPQLATQAATVTGNGTGPAGAGPSFVSAKLKKITTAKGKCGRGRIGIPAVPASWYSHSFLVEKTELIALCDQITFEITSGALNFVPGVFSWGPGTTHKPGWINLLNCILLPSVGSVKRRTQFRGK